MIANGRRAARWLVAIGCIGVLVGAPSSAAVIEAGHLRIAGEDGVGALAVRELALQGHRLWSEREPGSPENLRPATLELVSAANAAEARFCGRSIAWNAGTRRRDVVRTLAELWWEASRGEVFGENPNDWQVDALAVDLLVHLEPLAEAHWLRLAGLEPLEHADVVRPNHRAGDRLMAQRWLHREWLLSLRPNEVSSPPDPATRWAAFFLRRQATPRGPFLGLEASAQRIEALGQVNVRLRGEESREWIYKLPLDERRAWPDLWRKREMYLRALLPRVHPVYYRAAVALAGTLAPTTDTASFAEEIPRAWSEAQATAAEIRALLASDVPGN